MVDFISPAISAKFIAENASFVKIKQTGIQKLASAVEEKLKSGEISIRGFSESPVHPKPEDAECLDALLVIDALNFSFWTSDTQPKWTVKFKGCSYTGYFAMCAALMRAIEDGIKIWQPDVYSKLSKDQLAHILRSETETSVPLLDERLHCLNEVGEAVLSKFDGSFRNVVQRAENSAVTLLSLIVQSFPCFQDEANYKGKRVSLYKRAQILVADVWSCFQGRGLGAFADIDKITMFADYRVPQMLIHFDTLEYTAELQNKISEGVVLESGCEEEVEIRGCSIAVIEMVYEELVARGCTKEQLVNPILIDQWLWTERRRIATEVEHIGYHKCRTVFY